MLSGAIRRAAATVGTAVLRMVVSSDSMKNATATSQGTTRLTASEIGGAWLGPAGAATDKVRPAPAAVESATRPAARARRRRPAAIRRPAGSVGARSRPPRIELSAGIPFWDALAKADVGAASGLCHANRHAAVQLRDLSGDRGVS